MITNLQALRAFAALAVVFYHTGYVLFTGEQSSFQGVALFFCTSGFIMVFVSRENTDDFLLRRIIRIVPIYWIATIGFYFWTNLGLSNPLYTWPILWERLLHRQRALIDWVIANNNLTLSSIGEILQSLFFVPYQNSKGDWHPVLGVGWTLNLEMFFYVIFALALRMSRAYAPLIVVGILLIPKLIFAATGNPLAGFYGHIYTEEFILGIVCYYVWRALPVSWCMQNRITIASVSLVVAGLFILRNLFPSALSSGYGHYWDSLLLTFTFVMVLVLHSAGFRVRSKLVILLGGASYSIYLFHLAVLETQRTLSSKWSLLNAANGAVGAAVGIFVSTLVALAAYKLLELPISRYLNRSLLSRPRKQSQIGEICLDDKGKVYDAIAIRK